MIVVNRKQLKKMLQTVKKCTSSVYETCKFEVTDNQLTLTTINNVMDICVKLSIDVIHYDRSFTCLVNVVDLYDIVRKFKSDEIHIDIDNEFIIDVSCGDMQEKIAYSVPENESSKYSLELDEKAEQLDDKKSFCIDSDKLKDLIKRTTYASRKNVALQGLYLLKYTKFEIFKNYIKTVALDGYRLSMQLDHINGNVSEFDMLIFSEYLNILSKALPKKDLINVNVTKDGWVYFHWNNSMNIFKFQLCDDDYIKYQKIVPECDKFTTTIKVDRKQLLNAVKESKTYKKSNQYDDRILDVLDIHDNKLRLTYYGNHKSLGTKDIDILQYGDDIEIAFNPKFLEEALKANPEEFVKIKLIGNVDPIIIMDCSRDNIGLICPVRFRPEIIE